VHRTSHTLDWLLLAFLVAVLSGLGLYTWHQLGPENVHTGRAIFFGAVLICVFWAAVLYTFKLSVSVRVNPHAISIVRGPWRTELAWRDVARLAERAQMEEGQRLHWLVVFARDGRRMQIREDMVADYARLRLEVFERYKLWRDHGGTTGFNGGGPYTTRESLASRVSWWLVLAALALSSGLYFTILLPETNLVGPILLALAGICAFLSLRGVLSRQTYVVDAKLISARRFPGTVRLPWRDVARVDRARHPFSGVMVAGIACARFVLQIAARSDVRMQAFDWYPRVPEYLILRGTGRHVRIALHRVPRPDDLLAWIEFYESVGRRAARESVKRRPTPLPTPYATPQPVPTDMGRATGPLDPWAQGRDGTPLPADAPAPNSAAAPAAPFMSPFAALVYDGEGEDAWLRAEPELPVVGHNREPLVEDLPTAEMPVAGLLPSADSHASERYGSPQLYQEPQGLWQEARPIDSQRDDARHDPWEEDHPLAGSTSQLWEETQPQVAVPPVAANVEPRLQMPGVEPEFALPEAEDEDEGENTELLDAFGPRRSGASAPHWERPQLPRFGPPTSGNHATGANESTDDNGQFADDDFLR
jgi:hypothetical protein